MAGENVALRDIAVSHAIGLRRLSTGVVNKVHGVLGETEADLIGRIEKLDPTSVSSRYTRQRLDTLLRDVRALNKSTYSQVGSELKTDLIGIAQYETSYQAKAVSQVLGIETGIFSLPTRTQLVAAATDEPFNGRLLNEWVSGLEAGRYDRLRSAIRISVVQGESVNDLVRRIRGTPDLNYKDGILQVSRRSAETLARTAVSHAANQAQQLSFEENADILDGWRFVATLDSTTCEECAAYDGEISDVGDGVMPPIHPNCRCTAAPVVKGGGAAGRITYEAWLKDQPEEVQDEALGPTRAALYRDGDLKVKNFVDDLGRPLTLDQLSKIEAKAFVQADIFESAGKGYSEDAYVDSSGIIHTTKVNDAVKALWDDREVELDQPRQVSILIDRLAQVTRDMERAGEDAPNFNLCRVTVGGTSLFCVEGEDIPRIGMPQLKGEAVPGSLASALTPDARGEVDISSAFRQHLVDEGHNVVEEQELASYLHATQNELNGSKVAALADIERTTGLDTTPLFVSEDNYIVDGHHRWAAQIAVDFDDNIGDVMMDVHRVDADITTLVKEARTFAQEWGIPQQGWADIKTIPTL